MFGFGKKRPGDEQGLSQPTDVKLGETTLDEMCLGVYEILYKRQ